MNHVLEIKINYNVETRELFIDDKLIGVYNRKRALEEVEECLDGRIAKMQIENIVKKTCYAC